MPLVAGDVKLLPELKDPLSSVNAGSQRRLQDALGRSRARNQGGQVASGRPQGGYADEELNRANTMATRGMEDQLYGVLGNASHQDMKSQQEFERNKQLAERVGSLMSPSIFQQVVGGLGGGINAGSQIKSLYDSFQGPGRSGGSTNPSLSLYSGENPYHSNFQDTPAYDFQRWWGGHEPVAFDPYQDSYGGA